MKQIHRCVRAAFAIMASALCVLNVNADRTTLAWKLQAGLPETPWLGTGSLERGIAYNPVTDHLYLVTRSSPISVMILNADTGELVMTADEVPVPKKLSLTGVGGGTFAINMIGVADDGVIYGANLTTGSPTSPFKIYRWDSEDSEPALVYSGDPGGGATGAVRWGDSFDVRGQGMNTQLLAGAGASSHVAVFTTPDDFSFVSTRIEGAATTAGSISVSFGVGNTVWTKRPNIALRQASFDLEAGTATLARSLTMDPGTSIDVSDDGKYLAIVWSANPRNARVYDINDPSAAPVLVGTENFATTAANSNATGSADFGDGKVFVIDTNNGIVALNLIEEVTPVTLSPIAAINAFSTAPVNISVSAQGTPPLTYKWFFNGQQIENAAGPTLSLDNVTTAQSGDYTVEVSNAANTATGVARLTVTDPLDGPQLSRLWRFNPADKPYLAIAPGTDDVRGIAYSHVTGHIYVVSRVGGLAVHILDANTGEEVMENGAPKRLNLTGITGGGTYPLIYIGVADDGYIYGSSLTTDASSAALKIYRWVSEEAAPEVVYSGNPSNGATRTEDRRFGDTFDVRGSGVTTQILVTSRNGKYAAIIFPDPDLFNQFATAINVADAPDGSMGLGATFGDGNSFYATAQGSAVRRITFEDPVANAGGLIPGAIESVYAGADIPLSGTILAYDPGARLLAVTTFEIPDNVRLYRVNDDHTLEFLDQELFGVDVTNPNGTGALDFGGNKLVALNTSNGAMAFTVDPNPVQVLSPTLSAPMMMANGFMFNFTGSPNTAYTVEASADLINWDPIGGLVTTDANGNAMVMDETTAGAPHRFYIVVKR